MTEGIVGSPKETNPFKSETQVDRDLSKLLFSSLISNLDGDKFDLGLAQSVVASSDKLTYKVVLRDDIYFSNGDPITSEDVLYSIGNIPQEKNYTVEKESEKILTFKIRKDSRENIKDNFLQTFTYPILMKDQKFENNLSKNLVTSSFFKIADIDKDVDGNITRIDLQRFDNGEGKIPYLDEYNIIYFKDEVEAYTALQRKEVDLLSGIPGTTLSKLKDDTAISFEVASLPNDFSVFLNQNKNEMLRDKDLRLALSDAIDRTSLTNQVLGSYGIPKKTLLGNGGKLKTTKEILDDLAPSFIFKNGVLYMGTKETSDSKVKIKITTIQNRELEETAKFISNSWKKIGVETQIEIIDRKDLGSVVKNRDFEGLLFGISIKKESDYYSFFSSKERNYPKLNISNYTSKDADRILDVLVTETDKDRIQDLTKQLEEVLAKDGPIIMLYKPQFVFAHFLNTKIKLPEEIQEENARYAYIENWYTTTEKVLSIFNKTRLVDKLDIYFH